MAIVAPLPLRPIGRDIEHVIRLNLSISRLGLPRGFDGDPLAERFPDGRTLGDLCAAHTLLASLPAELRNWDRRVALRMCQAAVFGSTRQDDRSVPLSEPAKPSTDAKIARERNRNRGRRATA